MAKLTIGFGVCSSFCWASSVTSAPAAPTRRRSFPAASASSSSSSASWPTANRSKKRMLWMHISVTVALLGFLSMIPADIDMIRLSRGVYFPYPAAVEEKAVLALLCLLYVLFCVRSFINARRSRLCLTEHLQARKLHPARQQCIKTLPSLGRSAASKLVVTAR